MNANENNNNQTEQASFDPSSGPEFLREKIKQKPINKKKLLRRTLFTIMTAAIFGLVACLTFIFLEPLISSTLNKNSQNTEPQPTVVAFPDTDDEISPEDMYATDTEMIEEALQGNVADVNKNIRDIENMISDIQFGIEDYQLLYSELRNFAESISHSIVTVTGITENMDLLNNPYENNAQVSGLIVANNGPYLLILAKDNGLTAADELFVTFCDNTVSHSVSITGYDETTKLLILSVSMSSLNTSTQKYAVPAALGYSKASTLKGTPIIAIGSPSGITDSFDFGIVTSSAKPLGLMDSDCSLITTNITGTDTSSGVIVNLRGNVLGIIDNSYESGVANDQICAVGISELKPLIEKLSNNSPRAYFGIHGMDITPSMSSSYHLPEGVYLNKIEMDSPAMISGLQNGDILISIDGEEILTNSDLVKWLNQAEPMHDAIVTVKRQSIDDYITVTITVTLGSVSDGMEE